MGLYVNPELLQWFISEYILRYNTKPDMGKSCIRFKKTDKLPLQLLGDLVQKITATEWINCYEKQLKR
ncbi:hypothetical protein [Flavobacterium sp. UMI-01]|uniref:hypothetical protein n=1 Tax=Flavobacterium sp. UMI-01 TaxID=1441053 RepID=UPI0027E5ACEB|nr:hypothetical protein [Flavobacterium sp. UMI-01]